jgi:hypothetical protein
MTDEADHSTFPESFPEIGGREFQWVWKHKKEFCDFTLTEMMECTDFFLVWKNYCLRKQVKEDGGLSASE